LTFTGWQLARESRTKLWPRRGGSGHTHISGHGSTGARDVCAGWSIFGLVTYMILTALPPIRRYLFNLFYYNHFVLAIVTFLVACAHTAAEVLIGVVLWGIDLIVRYWYLAGE
jgi:hypothetical protein